MNFDLLKKVLEDVESFEVSAKLKSGEVVKVEVSSKDIIEKMWMYQTFGTVFSFKSNDLLKELTILTYQPTNFIKDYLVGKHDKYLKDKKTFPYNLSELKIRFWIDDECFDYRYNSSLELEYDLNVIEILRNDSDISDKLKKKLNIA